MPSTSSALAPPTNPESFTITEQSPFESESIAVWRDRYETERDKALFASLNPVLGSDALRQTAERLFGLYTPEHHDALLLEGDIMDPSLWVQSLGLSGGGEPFWFTVADVGEADLPPAVIAPFNHSDLRSGFAMLALSTPFGAAHVGAWWVRYDQQTLIMPITLLANSDRAAPLLAEMAESLSPIDCPECIYADCMDAKAKAEYQTFRTQWDGSRKEDTTNKVIWTFLCSAGAIITCSPPVVAIPALGQAACIGTAGCAAVNAICLAKNAVAFHTRNEGYANCLCAQSAQRAEGGPVGGCTPPPPPKCSDL
jgi:hypothetical protein